MDPSISEQLRQVAHEAHQFSEAIRHALRQQVNTMRQSTLEDLADVISALRQERDTLALSERALRRANSLLVEERDRALQNAAEWERLHGQVRDDAARQVAAMVERMDAAETERDALKEQLAQEQHNADSLRQALGEVRAARPAADIDPRQGKPGGTDLLIPDETTPADVLSPGPVVEGEKWAALFNEAGAAYERARLAQFSDGKDPQP